MKFLQIAYQSAISGISEKRFHRIRSPKELVEGVKMNETALDDPRCRDVATVSDVSEVRVISEAIQDGSSAPSKPNTDPLATKLVHVSKCDLSWST